MTRRPGRPPQPKPAPPVPALALDSPPVWDSALLKVGVLFAAALAAYYPALSAGFVWNDRDYVTKATLRSLHGLYLIWFKLGATEQYYPLLHSAFWIEHRLWGDSPLGYHLVNVLIHAASASLLWVILRRLAVPGAWVAALLFAVHPVCAESVAWISEEKNTLSTLFYLASAWTYLRFDERRRGTDYGLALAFFALALLSKTVAATLPAALLVVFWWRRGRVALKRDALPLLPWFALGAAGGLFSSYVERNYIGASGSDFNLSGVERVLVAGRAIWFYLGKLLWPEPLIFIYPRWHVSAASLGQFAFPLAAVACTGGLWLRRGRNRGLLAGWLFFVGSLFPTLGFFNVYAFVFSYVADHWQYLASIGVFALAGAGAAALWARAPAAARGVLAAGGGGIAILLGTLTARECGNYRDMLTFYRAILARNPEAWLAHNNLGFELEGSGRVAEAISHYEEALRLHPDYTECHANLGAALFQVGRYNEAIVQNEAAIRLMPKFAAAHSNLGAALENVGRRKEAMAQYREALRLQPDSPDAAYNLAGAYYAEHRLPEAIQEYEQVLRVRPDYAEAQRDLGVALCDAGRVADGVAHLEIATRLTPGDAAAQNSLGTAHYLLGQTDAAIVHYRAALQIAPAFGSARDNLGHALLGQGKVSEAIAAYQESARRQPRVPDTWYNLGSALEQAGRQAEAIAAFQQAVALKPDYAEAHNNLGAAYFSSGQRDAAAAEFALALKADPNLADAHGNLGVILLGRNQLPAALAEFETALRLKPNFAAAELNCGQILQALGRTAEAKIHLDRAARLSAGSPP